MTTTKSTIFERFLAPLFSQFLLDEAALLRQRDSIDWETECDRLSSPTVAYPDYYRSQNFHGIQNGYLSADAAITYDPITQYVLLPNETWIRQGLCDRVQGQPRRILDLGCGTGSTTVLLKQAFPDAEVIGLDLSPHMLVMAYQKVRLNGLSIDFRHGLAEATGFPDASFDVVTASLLFHETPPAIAQEILRECFRLLSPGGQVLILDGNQATLRQATWLTEIFEEPYIKAYAAGSVDDWMQSVGFEAVQTENNWWSNQVTRAQKPLLVNSPDWVTSSDAQVAMG
ncbi:MAG: class I SAM-dependent methyltransferase [Leptolyngbya sp. DLM2.Bin15]|nr:MAG: class I SAM-dependent methyltransferase [Leptolyngbya sp. DLM2.Bin15]